MNEFFLTLLLTLQKILVMFAFISVGYLFARKKLLPAESAKTMATLGTYVFFPAYLINNLSANFTLATLTAQGKSVLIGVGFLTCELAVAFLLALLFKKTKIPRNTLIYIFAFSNYGYFGYPVMEKVFGSSLVAQTIVFALPSTVAIASLGYFLLMGRSGGISKLVFSPTVLAIFVGILIGVSGITLPDAVSDILKSASACMSPVSMLLTGFVLGKFSFKSLFSDFTAYAVAAVRVILIPLIFALVLLAFGVRNTYFVIPVMICAMPVGMNTVMFAESAGRDSSENARICFISYILGLFSVPLWFGAMGLIA